VSRIWCYPTPIPVLEITNEGADKIRLDSIEAFDDSFPDPLDYCIGVFHPDVSVKKDREISSLINGATPTSICSSVPNEIIDESKNDHFKLYVDQEISEGGHHH